MAPVINKKLFFVKAHCFLKYGGLSFYSFMPVMVRQKGIPESGVGLIYTITPMISALTTLVVSSIADAFRIHRLVFLIAMTVLATAFAGVFFAPDIPSQYFPNSDLEIAKLYLQCHSNTTSDATLCLSNTSSAYSNMSNFQKHFIRNNNEKSVQIENCTVNNCILKRTIASKGSRNLSDIKCEQMNSSDVFNSSLVEVIISLYNMTCDTEYEFLCMDECDSQPSSMNGQLTIPDLVKIPQFWLIFLFLIFTYGSNMATATMADTLCFALLGEDRHKYGRQRMWGSLSQGIMGVVGGTLVNLYSQGQSLTNYTPAFIISFSLLVLNIFVSSGIKAKIPGKEKLKASSVRGILFSFKMILFLVSVVVIGMCTSSIWIFLFIIMEDVAKEWDPTFSNLKLLQGLMVGVDFMVGETFFMYLSPYIIKRLGNKHTFSLVLVAMSIRCLLYSTVTNPWFFLPINILHGITFGIFFTNMTAYASFMAPKGAEATIQGIAKTSFLGGISLGGLVTGIMLQDGEGLSVYLYLGLFVAAYSAFFIISHWIYDRLNTPNVPNDGHGDYTTPPENQPHPETGVLPDPIEIDDIKR